MKRAFYGPTLYLLDSMTVICMGWPNIGTWSMNVSFIEWRGRATDLLRSEEPQKLCNFGVSALHANPIANCVIPLFIS